MLNKEQDAAKTADAKSLLDGVLRITARMVLPLFNGSLPFRYEAITNVPKDKFKIFF
jgi:hypothetical protein